MANINKELTQIKTAIYGKDVRGSIHDGIDKINKESEGSRAIANDNKNRQDSLEQQFDDLQQNYSEGTPSTAEVVAARTNTDTNENYNTIGRRMDEEYKKVTSQLNETNSQLAQTSQQIFTNHPTTKRNLPKRPIITFLDDDGKLEAYTRLYPMLSQRGFKGSCALITSRLDTNYGNEAYMSKSQVKELMSNGWEMLGHTHNAHTDSMLDYTSEYLIEDIEECRRQLGLLGSTSRGFVYPQSNDTEEIQRITQKHFDYAFGRFGINQTENINPMNITRIGFGPWGNGTDLEYYKEQVDSVVANGGWLVFMLHVGNTSEEEFAVLEQLLDYIKSKVDTGDVDVVTPSEGYEIYGPKFWTGYRWGKYLSIVGDSIYGSFDLKLENNIPFKDIGLNAVTSDSGIREFEIGCVSVTKINSAFSGTVGNFPEYAGGILYTYKNDTSYHMFNRQEFHLYNSTTKYVRFPTSNTEWSPWEKFSSDERQEREVNFIFNTVKNEDKPSVFPSKKITVHYMSSAYAATTTFPTNEACTLTTTRPALTSDGGFTEQRLTTYGNEFFFRYAVNDTWNPWQKVMTETVV